MIDKIPLPSVIEGIPDIYYVVGGCIRDFLLQKDFSDFDIVVLDLKKVLSYFKEQKGRVITLSEEDGEFRVMFGKFWVDVSSLKGRDITEDLLKRDFTINSIAFDPLKNCLIDPANGVSDIKKGIIRTHSEENLKDDALRILRAARFFATLGFEIETRTMEFITGQRALLERISPERIRNELLLILNSGRVYKTFKLLSDTEILDVIFPDVTALRHTVQRYYEGQNLLYHSLQVLKYTEESLLDVNIENKGMLLLSAFLHDIGKPECIVYDEEGNTHFYGHDKKGAQRAAHMLRTLRFSNKEIETVTKVVGFHMYPHLIAAEENLTKKAAARFIRRTEPFTDFLLKFAVADAKASPQRGTGMNGYERLRKMIEDIREEEKRRGMYKPILTGYDLIGLGLKPGPLFKLILNDVEDERRAGSLLSREEALKYVTEKYVVIKKGGKYDK